MRIGGTLEMEDLRSYQVRAVDAWTVLLGDTLMHIPPPPAGGALLAFILKIMQGFFFFWSHFLGDCLLCLRLNLQIVFVFVFFSQGSL